MTDTSTLVEVVITSGVLSSIGEIIRWRLNRPKLRVDNAAVVQGMAVSLLGPLHSELDQAWAQVRLLRGEIEQVLGWAVLAHAELESHHMTIPSIPPALSDRIRS